MRERTLNADRTRARSKTPDEIGREFLGHGCRQQGVSMRSPVERTAPTSELINSILSMRGNFGELR